MTPERKAELRELTRNSDVDDVADALLEALDALDEAERELKELKWRVVANAGRMSRLENRRWAHVHDVVGLGSSKSKELCRAAGFDPDEMVGGET